MTGRKGEGGRGFDENVYYTMVSATAAAASSSSSISSSAAAAAKYAPGDSHQLINQPTLDSRSEWRGKQVYESEEELSIAEEHFSRYTSASIRPPEMWDLYRREEIGPGVDCWGLGCILYALTSGRMPFTDEDKLAILNCSYTVSRHDWWM